MRIVDGCFPSIANAINHFCKSSGLAGKQGALCFVAHLSQFRHPLAYVLTVLMAKAAAMAPATLSAIAVLFGAVSMSAVLAWQAVSLQNHLARICTSLKPLWRHTSKQAKWRLMAFNL